MYYFILSIFVFSNLRCGFFFKISIEKCLSNTIIEGFCRSPMDCVGVNNSMKSSNCSDGHICCPNRRVSEKRCDGYADAVYTTNFDTYDTDNDLDDNREDECGIAAVPLIIGGEQADYKEFPHMSVIGYGPHLTTAKWLCGGSLVSEFYILTAAHCLISHQGEPTFVKLGVINLETETSKYSQVFTVSKLIPHPAYKSPNKWHDIALIKLKKTVEFTPFVRPACLDYEGEIKQDTAVATGWGYTDNGIDKGSPDLMKVELHIAERSQCDKVYHGAFKGNLTDSLICAGTHQKKDTCNGDSGGPLQIVRQKPYCMYSIIGVTSFGISCGHGVASVYTRVFYYLPWVESIVWPEKS